MLYVRYVLACRYHALGSSGIVIDKLKKHIGHKAKASLTLSYPLHTKSPGLDRHYCAIKFRQTESGKGFVVAMFLIFEDSDGQLLAKLQ